MSLIPRYMAWRFMSVTNEKHSQNRVKWMTLGGHVSESRFKKTLCGFVVTKTQKLTFSWNFQYNSLRSAGLELLRS